MSSDLIILLTYVFQSDQYRFLLTTCVNFLMRATHNVNYVTNKSALHMCDVYSSVLWIGTASVGGSNGNDIETKAEQSFDLGFVFDIEAK